MFRVLGTGSRYVHLTFDLLSMRAAMEPKIEQFVAVTGASVEAARSLLEACGGNLDLAIDMHMEGKQGPSSGLGDVAGKSYEEM